MGSDFSKHICCVTCGTCKKQELEEGNEVTSETKPILQGKTSLCAGLQPSSPALEAFQQGSEEVQALSQQWQPPADAVETEVETYAADLLGVTEAWQAACDSTGFLVAPAGGDPKEEGEALTQAANQQEGEKVSETEEELKLTAAASEAQPAADAVQEKLAAELQQPQLVKAGSEGSPCAGVALQERNMFNLMEFPRETAAGQAFEIRPSGETLMGRNLLLSSVQVSDESEIYFSAEQVGEIHWAEPAEVSPQTTRSAERAPLPGTSVLQPAQKAGETVEPSEVIADVTAEIYSSPTLFWESLYPGGESLEPANQLLVFLQQGIQSSVPTVQEMESLRCGEPAELSEASQQLSHGALGEERESREHSAEAAASEAEPWCWTVQQRKELPDKPTCAQVSAEEETETLSEASRLSQELGSTKDA